jgi:hypothetical protein
VKSSPPLGKHGAGGQFYRKSHDLVKPTVEIEGNRSEGLLHLSWLEGYTAADEHFQEPMLEDRQ